MMGAMHRLWGLFILVAPLVAQDITGSIQGRVTDPTGAAVSNAKIELVSEQTNSVTVRQSNLEGSYIFNLLPPGRYTLKAAATAFGDTTLPGVVVEINKATRADIPLQLGSISANP